MHVLVTTPVDPLEAVVGGGFEQVKYFINNMLDPPGPLVRNALECPTSMHP